MQKKAETTAPIHLRNAPIKLMKDLGYGSEYLYNPTYRYMYNHFSLNLSFSDSDDGLWEEKKKDILSSNNIFHLTYLVNSS